MECWLECTEMWCMHEAHHCTAQHPSISRPLIPAEVSPVVACGPSIGEFVCLLSLPWRTRRLAAMPQLCLLSK